MSTCYRYCEVCKIQHESRERCPNGAVLSWLGQKYITKQEARKELDEIKKNNPDRNPPEIDEGNRFS